MTSTYRESTVPDKWLEIAKERGGRVQRRTASNKPRMRKKTYYISYNRRGLTRVYNIHMYKIKVEYTFRIKNVDYDFMRNAQIYICDMHVFETTTKQQQNCRTRSSFSRDVCLFYIIAKTYHVNFTELIVFRLHSFNSRTFNDIY